MTLMKRSTAVPLTLVPALASVVACGNSQQEIGRKADPCLPAQYVQEVCNSAVQNRGYHYGGFWYPMIYAMPALAYYNGYSRHVASGGRMRVASASSYSPRVGAPTAGRSTVVRGGFGGIGGSRGFSGG